MKNKNESKSFFDTLALITLFAVLFSIGMHIGKNAAEDPIITATITVTIKNASFSKEAEELITRENNSSAELAPKLQALGNLLIDGKYECDVIYIDETTLRFTCQGKQRAPGFLICGAKYLSENQPIELKGEGSYIYGRIGRIADREL